MAKDTRKMDLALGRPIAPRSNPTLGRAIGSGVDSGTATDTLEPSDDSNPVNPPALTSPAGAASDSNIDPTKVDTMVGGPVAPPIEPNLGQNNPAPTAGDRLKELTAQGAPEYHGFKRFADTLAGTTRIGQAIESAGHFGTAGYMGDLERAGAGAKLENEQLNAEVGRQKTQGDIQHTQAETGHAEAQTAAVNQGMQDVAVYNPVTQEWVKIPQKDYAGLQKTITSQVGSGQRTTAQQAGATDRADAANTSRENIAAGKAKYADIQTPDGHKVPGKVDGQGNLLLADGSPAPKGSTEWKPPTYAEIMGGRITDLMIDGVPTKVQVTPTGTKVIGESGTGAFAGKVSQAKIVQSAGDQLIQDIQAHKDKLGNMGALVSAALLGTPWSDPETQQLYAEIGSYIALHPAMHGFRGTNALQHFGTLIGGIPNNPDSMIAGIQGLTKMADIFTDSGSTQGKDNAQAPHGAQPSGEQPPKPQPGMKVQKRVVNGKTEYRQVPIGQ